MTRMKGGKSGGRKGGKKTGGLEGSWRERKREGGQEGGQASRGQERVAEGREGREGAAERGRAGESWPGVVLWRRERVSGVCGSLPRARASLVLCVGEPSRCLVAPRIPGRGRACGGRAGVRGPRPPPPVSEAASGRSEAVCRRGQCSCEGEGEGRPQSTVRVRAGGARSSALRIRAEGSSRRARGPGGGGKGERKRMFSRRQKRSRM